MEGIAMSQTKKDKKRTTQTSHLEKTLQNMPIIISNISNSPEITKPLASQK